MSNNDATCTADGTKTAKCDRCDETDTQPDVGSATGHSYGEPVWTWSEDYSTATATFTCPACGDTQEVTATIDETVVSEATGASDKIVTYTASATFEGATFTDAKENVAIPGTKTELLIEVTDSNGKQTSGNQIGIDVPYARRGEIALKLNASDPNATFEVDKKGSKIVSVDKDGNVKFKRLCIFCRTAVITATTPDGKKAVCTVTMDLKWWQVIIFLLFGCLWY